MQHQLSFHNHYEGTFLKGFVLWLLSISVEGSENVAEEIEMFCCYQSITFSVL